MGLRGLLGATRQKMRRRQEARAVQAQTQVVSGPGRVTLQANECAVVSMMKDAGFWVADFIRHHQDLGVRHIVILDNGSSDDTVQIAQGFDHVTVLRNTLPAKQYECHLREAAARQVVQGGWILFADSDEMAEILGGLRTLLDYCNAQGFTAVVSQMLDLFAPLPLSQTRGLDYAQARAVMDRYSLGALGHQPYFAPENPLHWFLKDNRGAEGVDLLIGGLRREVFGEDCLLSKHSLVRNLPGAQLMTHPHTASKVTVADVSFVLRHYKLAGDFVARDQASVVQGTWDHSEDARRLDTVGARDFQIEPAQSHVYAGPGQLVEQGFLVASQTYSAFASQK